MLNTYKLNIYAARSSLKNDNNTLIQYNYFPCEDLVHFCEDKLIEQKHENFHKVFTLNK